MPYKSEAQRRYFHANEDKLRKQGVDVSEWDRASKGKPLPERAGDPHDHHKHLDGHAKKQLGHAGHPEY
jgi:hypothetical protein